MEDFCRPGPEAVSTQSTVSDEVILFLVCVQLLKVKESKQLVADVEVCSPVCFAKQNVLLTALPH